MGKKEDKKAAAAAEHNHTGSVVAEDEELTKVFTQLWERNEPPERVEVYQVFGKEKRDRGEMIFHQDFPPGSKMDPEKCTRLSNEIIATAQNDCDSTPKRREAYFQIAIIDKMRRSQPLVRRLGPLRPKRNLAIVRGDDGESDMDEEELSVRNLEHARLKTGFEEVRWGNVRNDRVLGELLLLMRDVIQEQRDEARSLRAENRELRTQWNEAEDRSAVRKVQLEKEQFKISLMRDGVRTARNLLPGLFAEAKADSVAANEQTNGHSNGNTNGSNNAPNYGPSPERTLVDNFLSDCEENQLSVKLFGDYELSDGKVVQKAPGIFSMKQSVVLHAVREGRMPVDALVPLMPGAEGPLAITMEQIKEAMDAGVTDGIGISLIELKNMMQKRQEAASTNNATGK